MRLWTATLTAVMLWSPMAAKAAGSKCRLSAYFVDQDPATNVRAAPSMQAKVIAMIDPANAVATIRGAQGDWFRVDSILDYETDKLLFRGSGWVHASVVGLSVAGGDHRLYAAPTARSAVLQKLTTDGNMLDLLDCRGEWVKVRVDKKKIGWMSPLAQCANPFTTCS